MRRTIEELGATGAAEKVTVFTQRLPTFEHLHKRLYEADLQVFPVPAESDEEVRAAMMRKFQEHEGAGVLLATDALPEGADIHAANCIVDHDLPYNPRRIERRIGRVDRAGQTADTICVVNLITPGSVDEGIERLLLSRSCVDHAAGELPMSLTEGIDELDAERSMDAVRRAHQFLDRRGIGGLGCLRDADEALDGDIRTFDGREGKDHA